MAPMPGFVAILIAAALVALLLGPTPTGGDCAGVPGGNATIDCNAQCCGGNTTINCAELNACMFCIPFGADNSTGTDCAGQCFGNAVLDSCFQCCNGSTGVTCNALKDACGICNGTNSTCLGTNSFRSFRNSQGP